MADAPNTWVEWFGQKFWENREAFLAWVRGWFGGKKSAGESGSDQEAPERGVLVLGPGGVGKTTFGKLISGDADLLFELPHDYRESTVTEVHPPDAPEGTGIIIPPGQEHRRATSWREALQALADGRYRGVIVVVAHGYHNHEIGEGISYKDHHLYHDLGGRKTVRKFLDHFLAARRADELTMFRQLMPYLIAASGKTWLLTLVAKQDLWWADRTVVDQFYRSGEYGSLVKEVAEKKQPERFRHELAFASFMIRNFKTGRGELLRPNTAGYDFVEHGQSLRSLFEMFDSLRTWDAK